MYHAYHRTALAAACVAAALCGCGGAPSELEVKGLRLGMNIEDAARVMVGHGYQIGGDANLSAEGWAFSEHFDARQKHAAEYVRGVCAEKGFKHMGEYLRFAAERSGVPFDAVREKLMMPITEEEHRAYANALAGIMANHVRAEAAELGAEELSEFLRLSLPMETYRANEGYIRLNYPHRIAVDEELRAGVLDWFNRVDRLIGVPAEGPAYSELVLPPEGLLPEIVDYVGENFPDGTLALANLEELLKQWTDPSFVLVPEEAKFPDLDAYVAEHYPNGRPYHLGGPWDGKAELKLEEGLTGNRVLQGSGWGFGVNAERKVEAMEFRGDAIEKLFGAGDMSAEEFATSFAKAYRVPLKPTAEVADPDIAVLTGNILKTGWSFVNRDAGWAVGISDAKVLQIQSITPASRQAFD